jgi:hypothetical protein
MVSPPSISSQKGRFSSIEPPLTCQFSPQLQRTAQQPIIG